jgi:molecular chaperone GrpE
MELNHMKKPTTKNPIQPQVNPELENLKSSLARALADYANLERRFSEQSSSVVKFATANLLTKLLDLRDHLEMAATQLKDQSLNMILSSFDKLLQSEGVEVVKTEGQYDPTTMECQELSAGPKDQVVKVVRSGYRLHDRVLRTARVVVGNGTEASVPTN